MGKKITLEKALLIEKRKFVFMTQVSAALEFFVTFQDDLVREEKMHFMHCRNAMKQLETKYKINGEYNHPAYEEIVQGSLNGVLELESLLTFVNNEPQTENNHE